MKKIALFSLAVASYFFTCCTAPSVTEPAIAPSDEIEAKVESLLKKMTLEEKVGQMCQLNIDVIQDRSVKDKFVLSEALMDTVFRVYKVGSILNVPFAIAQPLDVWESLIDKIQEVSMEEIGIPCLYGVDQIHGTTYTIGGTFFPQGINMAATFNRELVRNGAKIVAYEAKAGGVPWTFSPVLDLARDARWPRHWENYGEDSYVNAQMGREAVLGFQGEDPNKIGENSVAACLKHYMGYGVPVSGKDRTPSSITEQDMRERHFAPFVEAIRGGALSVMVNSAMNNGLPFHANYELLTEWLKEGLNWDGVIVTDWADINNMCTRDHVAATKKEAIKMAINAGIDISMVPYEWSYCRYLKELVEEGEVSMERIDDAVRRVLRMKFRLNLFDKPCYDAADYPNFGCDEHAAAALAAAEESIVLLKNNDGLLPLVKGKRVLVTGPNANSMRSLNGGWSYTWQGSGAEHLSEGYNTILEALQNKLGVGSVVYEPGVTYNEKGQWWEENKPQIQRAVAAARGVDYIIACVGENSYCETPGNLDDLTLSRNQLDLVKALAGTGKPIVLVLNQGRPRIINEIEPLAGAVVNVMLPGNYGGDALANLLVGDVNFSGKMPYTYPKAVNSLITYDYKPCEHIGEQMEGAYNYDAQVSVQWMFGYGLSYTTFAYSNLSVDNAEFVADDILTFSVDVTNTGKVAGKESVLLFSSDLVASLTPDIRRLRGFEKVELQPGETKRVTLQVAAKDLAFVGYDGKWILEEGDFKVQVGDQVVEVECIETKKWESQNL